MKRRKKAVYIDYDYEAAYQKMFPINIRADKKIACCARLG